MIDSQFSSGSVRNSYVLNAPFVMNFKRKTISKSVTKENTEFDLPEIQKSRVNTSKRPCLSSKNLTSFTRTSTLSRSSSMSIEGKYLPFIYAQNGQSIFSKDIPSKNLYSFFERRNASINLLEIVDEERILRRANTTKVC